MVVTVNQRLRGHLEVTTQVQCPLATVLDTNGTLSFQSPIALEGDPISSLTLPGGESLPAQLPIQQGSLQSGTIIVPAALRDTRQNLKGERRPVPNSTQRETGLLQKPEGCEKKLSVGLLEETHGKRKKRQSTSIFCESSPTSTQRPSTGAWSLAHQETTDLMGNSSTTKVSLPPVTGSRVPRCRETSNLLVAGRSTEEQLASRSSVAFSASGQSGERSLHDPFYSKPVAQRFSQPGTWEQATSGSVGFRDKPPSGNWAKIVSPTNYDRTMLKAERWPSIDESATFSSCRIQAGIADQGGGYMGRYKELSGSQFSQADMQRAYPAGRRRHQSPLKQSWLHNQLGQARADGNCPDASLTAAATKGLSRVKAAFYTLPTLNLKCIGKGVTLKQAPKPQSRMLLPPLTGRRHSSKDSLLTFRGKRKWDKAAGKSETEPRSTGNKLPPLPPTHNTEFASVSSSHQETLSQKANSFDLGVIEPVLLMVNKDFAVTSPVKKNLLLTIALSQNKEKQGVHGDTGQDGQEHSGDATCSQKCGQILVGQFTAFSSLMGFGLGHDARRVATEQNAGGSSTISESLSVEYFVRRFQARDVVTEMEVEYSFMNMKKVDYVCTIFGQRVGVSVTRAMSYPDPKNFSADTAVALLRKKLFGLVVARSGVTSRHSFSQCILHVWCETRNTAKILEEKYPEISTEMQVAEDVIMVLTVAEGSQARPIFYEACLNSKLSSTKEFLWCF